jgi:Family of unknown function (DUF6666)
MFDARHTASRLTIATLVICVWCTDRASAQSAATSGEQWRPAGVTRPVNVQAYAPASNSPAWRLPNGQQPADLGQTADDDSNPLRPKDKPQPKAATTVQEPRSFQPPNNVKKLTASQPAATGSAAQPVRPRSTSAAIAKAPAAASAAKQAYSQSNARTSNQLIGSQQPAYQRPAYQHPPQSNQMRRNVDRSVTGGSLWDTITVAFQGEPASKPAPKSAPESLPAPRGSNPEFQDPVMKHFDGPGEFIGPYQPYGYGGPQGCDDGSCGDPACGCGCACGDPGCDCEPGCDCQPGCTCDHCRHKEVFCIGPGDDESCHIVQIRWPKWQEVVVFSGVQGFKGPYDQARDSGNFGFNEGFNIGAKIPYAQLGYQFGWRGAQSQLNGDKNTGIDNQHFQEFATAGLFHRQCEGLNYGVAWDMLNDERWQSQHFHQLRTEISVVNGGCHEIGFTTIIGLNDHGFDDGEGGQYFYQASDQYLLFYRFRGCNGGEGRFFAGGNDDSDGLLGADMLIPVGDRFSVQAGFEYLIPNAKNGTEGATLEAWNIGLGLVWHWDGQARKCFDNCYRPMFNVADNGTLIVDRRNHKN